MCGSEHPQEVDWALRIRACASCTAKRSVELYNIVRYRRNVRGNVDCAVVPQALPSRCPRPPSASRNSCHCSNSYPDPCVKSLCFPIGCDTYRDEHHPKVHPKNYKATTWPHMVSPYFLKKDDIRLAQEVEAIAARVEPTELSAKLEDLREGKALAHDKAMNVSMPTAQMMMMMMMILTRSEPTFTFIFIACQALCRLGCTQSRRGIYHSSKAEGGHASIVSSLSVLRWLQ